MHPVAARRALRLALASALCLAVALAAGWPLSYLSPVITVMLLALPVPPLRPAQGIGLLVAMLAPMVLGMALLPFLWQARWAGVGLVTLLLFHMFLFASRGGSPLLATFMTIGLTVVVTVGSVSPLLLQLLLPGIAGAIFCGLLFSWLGHLLLPELPLPVVAPPPPPAAAAAPAQAVRRALRALFVVLPLALVFLFASGSPALTPVMIKSATLGQQASSDDSRRLGLMQLLFTFWGGVAALACWQILSIWPSLLLFTLVTAVVCLLAARHLYAGTGAHARAPMVTYALVTYFILIGPSVADSAIGSSAGEAFQFRLLLFGLIAVYATLAVRVFDAFWPAQPWHDNAALPVGGG
jgi:hypothetical protein